MIDIFEWLGERSVFGQFMYGLLGLIVFWWVMKVITIIFYHIGQALKRPEKHYHNHYHYGDEEVNNRQTMKKK